MMIAFSEELVREVSYVYGLIYHRWSSQYVETLLPNVMLRMANKGYVVNGAYGERALRSTILNSVISVDSEWD